MAAIKQKRDSVWQKALQNNWEYFFYLVRQNDTTTVVGITTDEEENEVTPKKATLGAVIPEGDYHTHQDSLAKDRHLHDPMDIGAGNGRYLAKQDFASYVDCGDTIYVLVTQNLATFKNYVNSHNFENGQTAWYNSLYFSNNRRGVGLSKLKEYIGSTENSGLGLYKTTDSTFTNFIKIND